MTTLHTEPPAMPTSRRRWPWVVAGVVVVVAAVVVTLVLTAGGADGGAESAAPTSTKSGSAKAAADEPYDLSSPEAAAASFVAAARSGSGDLLVSLACVGRPACVREHAAEATEAQLAEAQNVIREGVYELAVHLEDAEFIAAVEGTTPGTKDVPYRTPAMTGDDHLTLTFVESDGDWLYYSPTV